MGGFGALRKVGGDLFSPSYLVAFSFHGRVFHTVSWYPLAFMGGSFTWFFHIGEIGNILWPS